MRQKMSHRLHASWSISLIEDVTYLRLSGLNTGVMKICPKCGKTYADESVAFCFNDGFPLLRDLAASSAAPVQGSQAEVESSEEGSGAQPAALGAVPEPSVELPRAGLQPVPLPQQLSSNPTLMPMDLDPIDWGQASLGEHHLGELLALDSESALFDVGHGKAAWIHRPDRPSRQSFVKRAEAAKGVRDLGVLRIRELGEFKGLAYAVVDRPKGRNLVQIMQRLQAKGVERLDAAEVLDLGTGLAWGISALQAAGGLVGDVHPGRIWMNHDGGALLLAGVGEAPVFPPRAALDRWSIQAPELSMRREHAEGRADIFSLGAILWTLLTGQRHTLKSDWSSTVQATRGAAPLELASPLHELLAQCMHAEPTERPESAAALAKALDRMRGAQRGSWRARLLTAFPIGSSTTPDAEQRALVEQIKGVCTGSSPMPAVQHVEELVLPEWPLPASAVTNTPLATEAPTGEASGTVDPVPEPVSALPFAAESVQDDDSLGGGFFSHEPSDNDTPFEDEEADDELLPPVPQRSWGLALGGALLGVLLLVGGGYVWWSQAQDSEEAPAATLPIEQPAERAARSEPPPAPTQDADLVVPDAEVLDEPVAEPVPVEVAPEPEPELQAEPKPPKKEARPRRSGNRPVKGTRPNRNGAPSAGSGSGASGGNSAPKPKAKKPASEESWEPSPWGDASEGSEKKSEPVQDNGSPWGSVE